MVNLKSVKIQLIIFLVIFVLYTALMDRNLIFLLSAAFCVASAVLAEVCLRLSWNRRFVFSDSAVITGLIIAFVLGSGQGLFIYVLASVLAIVSKYVVRIQKRHIFNPAAFGIFSAILLFSATTQWKGTYQWYIILPAGLYFAYRIHKLGLLAGYAVTALSLWGVQALLEHVNILYIFGYFSYFFIFIMLIEPKTTPIRKAGKILFGGIVALVIFIFTEAGLGFDVELLSLLIGNAAVPLLNRLK